MCLICLSAFTTKANCERHLKVHTDTLSGRWGLGRERAEWVSVGPSPPQDPDTTACPQVFATAVASSPPQGTFSTATW